MAFTDLRAYASVVRFLSVTSSPQFTIRLLHVLLTALARGLLLIRSFAAGTHSLVNSVAVGVAATWTSVAISLSVNSTYVSAFCDS